MCSKLQKERRKKCCNDEIRKRTVATFIQSCWRRYLARKELQRLQNKAKEVSIQLIGDSRTNQLEERGNDMIQARSNLEFDVKCETIQFHGNSHNSQSYHWIVLKFYVKCPDMLSYVGLKYHVNLTLARTPKLVMVTHPHHYRPMVPCLHSQICHFQIPYHHYL